MKKAAVLIVAMLMFFAASAFAEGGLNIVCTNFPCYDFARAVAGDQAQVHMLIKPGTEVHSYEPTPADVMAIAQCDLFIYIGGESDAWVQDILASFGADTPAGLRMIETVADAETEAQEHAGHAHEYDEHIWTSPVNAIEMVAAVSDALVQLDSSNAAAYATNAQAYISEIRSIDAQIREIVDNAARREMIFADRFPFIHFTNEYGLSYMAAFPTCSAEGEPSAKTIADLIMKITRDKIPVVYTIEMSNCKVANTLCEETGVKVLTFHSAQTLSEADFAAGETYVSLMQKNIEALQEGLN